MVWRFIDKLRYRLIGIRKILFAIFLLVTTTSMVLTGFLASADFASIWVASAPALMIANLGEYLVSRYTRPNKEEVA